jgi:hypothetical protein
VKHHRKTLRNANPSRSSPQSQASPWANPRMWPLLWPLLVIVIILPLLYLATGADLIDLRDDTRSIIFAAATASISGALWWRERETSPLWAGLALAWLATTGLNHLAATSRTVPVTTESSRTQTVYYKSQHTHHDLLLRAATGHTWRARFFASRGARPVPLGTLANATISVGPLWDDVESLTLPERTLHASRVP